MVVTHNVKCFIITNQACTSFLAPGDECEYIRVDKISYAFRFSSRDAAEKMVEDITSINKCTDLQVVHPMTIVYKIDLEVS